MSMVLLSFTSTISRLNPLQRSSLYLKIRPFKKLGTTKRPYGPACSVLCFSLKPPSAHFYSVRASSDFNIAVEKRKSQLVPDEGFVFLGIETSCDDTAAAVVNSNGEILSQVISSQAELLAKYGGVAPKMAEQAHSQVIDQDCGRVWNDPSNNLPGRVLPPVIVMSEVFIRNSKVVQEALCKAKLTEKDLTAVAVTIGPGLSLCLRVGVRKARQIAGAHNLPMVGVHHMEAHTLVARLVERETQFPFLALLVSGGHNLLILARGLGDYIQLGTTIDDAIGEAYDKTAKWLGLDLRKSGGPAIEKLALEGNADSVKFNVPMKHYKNCNFSYAGLKTQVRLAIEARNIDAGIPISTASSEDRQARADIAASFQRVAVLHLEDKCKRAIEWALKIEPSVNSLVVSGGVASNQYVRDRLNQVVKQNEFKLVCPPPSLCTDNGVMVAWTGIEHFRVGRFDPPPPADEPEDALDSGGQGLTGLSKISKLGGITFRLPHMLDLRPRWPLGEEYAEGKSEARSQKTARLHPSLTSLIQQASSSIIL